jgi:peptidoglycan/xylan/chitin deacetylase (PgdA/CDA1 family)
LTATTRPDESRVLAINFHFVGPNTSSSFPGIHFRSADEFSKQLDALSASGQAIKPDALERGLKTGDIPAGFVLTFDDGLRDHYEFVAPELNKRGWEAFFFINTGAWEGTILDVHKLQLLNASLPVNQLGNAFRTSVTDLGIDLDFNTIPEKYIRSIYTYDEMAVARLKYAINFLMSTTDRHIVIDDVFERFAEDIGPAATELYMTPQQVAELHSQGHVIGGHTTRHLGLSRQGPGERAADLEANLSMLRTQLGEDTRWFSFPFGDDRNPAVIDDCRDHGVKYAFTMNRGHIVASSDVMALPRVDTNDAPGGRVQRYTL